GSEVVLDGSQLSLAESIRASMAVPMIFTPVELGEQLLVDGGLVKNLPVDIVRNMGAEIVIAVNVSTPLRSKEDLRSLVAIMDQTMSLQIVHSTEQQVGLADIVITPDLQEFSSADFVAAKAIMARGEEAAHAQAGALRQLADALHRASVTTSAPAADAQNVASEPKIITIEEVIITGNVSTRDLSLLKDAGIKKGQTLKVQDLASRIESIFGGGFFESVKFGIRQGKRGGYVLKVDVKERELNVLHVGVRYDDKNNGVGLTGLTLRPWERRNALLSADLEFGGVFGIQGSYLQYRLFDTGLFFQPRVFYRDEFQQIYANNRKVGEFKNRAGGFELAVGNTFRNIGEVTGRYQWRSVSFVPDRRGRGFRRFTGNIAAVSLGSYVDTLDRFPFPRTGHALTLSASVADKSFGGDVSFTRLYLGYHEFISPISDHTLLFGLRLGSAAGTRMPVSEEFLFGGPEYFVGYAREELRGAYMGVARLEYRYKLFDLPTGVGEGTYLHLVFNSGNIWRTWNAVEDHFRLRYGGGIGVGIDSVIGPIAVGYGRGDEEQDEVYLSIGVPF
ncbi:MAG: BamA/TamA family outer membrane protein, partial [Candidatus Binatia bacterium]